MNRTSNCVECRESIEYNSSQQIGKFCSHKCQQWYQTRLLVESGNAGQKTSRRYLLRTREYRCECGVNGRWNGKPLTLQLDHIDGNIHNSLPSNLRWQCPNCHTQTETWGSKNASDDGRKRMLAGAKLGYKRMQEKLNR